MGTRGHPTTYELSVGMGTRGHPTTYELSTWETPFGYLLFVLFLLLIARLDLFGMKDST